MERKVEDRCYGDFIWTAQLKTIPLITISGSGTITRSMKLEINLQDKDGNA